MERNIIGLIYTVWMGAWVCACLCVWVLVHFLFMTEYDWFGISVIRYYVRA